VPNRIFKLADKHCGKCGKLVSKLYGNAISGFVQGVCSKCLAEYTVKIISQTTLITSAVSKFLVENGQVKEGDRMPLGEELYQALLKAKEFKNV
jgi:hypothetical protein